MATVTHHLSTEQTKTLIRILDHNIKETLAAGHTSYEIDKLCRDDSRKRWREIRDVLNKNLTPKERM